MEAQSLVSQTQFATPTTGTTATVLGTSLIKQVIGPTEKVDTSTVVAFAAPPPVHKAVQMESSVGNPAKGTSVGIGKLYSEAWRYSG